MKTIITSVLLSAAVLLLAGCGAAGQSSQQSDSKAKYVSITQEEAKKIMDSDAEVVILDVRSQSEYDEGHIEGAVLIPHDEIESRAEAELTDKEQTILVYCRSGNRSKVASQALAELGYTDVREFGGINTWQYGTVK